METASEFPSVTDDHFTVQAASVTICEVVFETGMRLVKDGFVGSIQAFECRNGALVLSVMELPRSALAIPRKRRIRSHELFGADGWQLQRDTELGRMKLRHGAGVVTISIDDHRQAQAVQALHAAHETPSIGQLLDGMPEEQTVTLSLRLWDQLQERIQRLETLPGSGASSMSPESFAYWLRGFDELNPKLEAPTSEQWAEIVAHLRLVFRKVTPPIQSAPQLGELTDQLARPDHLRWPLWPDRTELGNAPVLMC